MAAVETVYESGLLAGAQGYRAKLGLELSSRMAVVIQALIDADVAGVLFTRHPVTGADERVIEASWGLGEAVVAGLVTPDNYRLARGGQELERPWVTRTSRSAPSGGDGGPDRGGAGRPRGPAMLLSRRG